MLEVDGSYGEGGGQIVRAAVAYSCISRQPVKIYNIRAKRPKPGLRKQHVTAIKLLSKIFKAEVHGVHVGSTEMVFIPGEKLREGNFHIDVGSAGSITLVLQSVTFALIGKRKRLTLTIKGGTDVPFSPTFDYFRHCYLSLLSRFGYDAEVEIIRRGYYPEGGGEVKFTFRGHEQTPLILDESSLSAREFCVYASASKNLERARVCERIVKAAVHHIKRRFGDVDVRSYRQYSDTVSTGASLCIVAHNGKGTLGADILGRKGLPSEELSRRCVEKLKKEVESGACVDAHLADHLVPFLAMCGGRIKTSTVTTHTETMLWLAEKFFGKRFEVDTVTGMITVK